MPFAAMDILNKSICVCDSCDRQIREALCTNREVVFLQLIYSDQSYKGSRGGVEGDRKSNTGPAFTRKKGCIFFRIIIHWNSDIVIQLYVPNFWDINRPWEEFPLLPKACLDRWQILQDSCKAAKTHSGWADYIDDSVDRMILMAHTWTQLESFMEIL